MISSKKKKKMIYMYEPAWHKVDVLVWLTIGEIAINYHHIKADKMNEIVVFVKRGNVEKIGEIAISSHQSR